MRTLNNEQLMHVSGGTMLDVTNADTYRLVLAPGDFFFLVDFKTADTYLFGDKGNVKLINPVADISHSVSFPFKIVNEVLCEYSIPSSYFNRVSH